MPWSSRNTALLRRHSTVSLPPCVQVEASEDTAYKAQSRQAKEEMKEGTYLRP